MEARLHIVAIAAAACTLGACAQAPTGTPAGPVSPPPPTTPGASPEQPGARPPAGAVPLTPEADQVLSALERAGGQIQSLSAQVRYDRYSPLMGDRQVRVGKLYFLNPRAGAGVDADKPGAGKKFAILFEQLFLGDQKREDQKSYVFDGEWLVEKIPSEKLVIRRQLVAPGEQFDPLRIGQGPLPIPIGQPKTEILSRFSVELRPATDGLQPAPDADTDERALLDDMRAAATTLPETYQLRLVPRGDPKEADFKEVRLWYTKGPEGVLVPRMARTVNPADEVSSVLLVNVQAQLTGGPENPRARPSREAFDTRTPSGWEEKTEDFRTHEEAPRREPPEAGDR